VAIVERERSEIRSKRIELTQLVGKQLEQEQDAIRTLQRKMFHARHDLARVVAHNKVGEGGQGVGEGG
jgi:hypothetical protein